MNIDQAKTIALCLILDKLGIKPVKESGPERWYRSPLRRERTASFHVQTVRNIWYDFGIGKGGNTLDFAVAYLESQGESCTVPDALRWLEILSGQAPVIQNVEAPPEREEEPSLVLMEKGPVTHQLLVRYLESRGIPLEIARNVLKQVRISNRNTGRKFFALALINEEKGWEIRNPFFKGCIGNKGVSFIRGKTPKPDSLHIFEGIFDYLSTLAHTNKKTLDGDTLILNSLSCMSGATPYIKSYGYRAVYSWMDNDEAGKKATASLDAFLETEDGLSHKPMNRLYAPHKDVNAWHVHKLGL